MKTRFKRRQARFRAIESTQCRSGGGGADLGETGGLFTELPDRLLVNLPECGPFLLDDAPKLMHAGGGVLLRAPLAGSPDGQLLLELADSLRLTLAGDRPAIDDLGALFRELRQPALHRLQMIRSLP